MYQLSVNKLKIASTLQTLDIITVKYLDNIELRVLNGKKLKVKSTNVLTK